MIFIMFGKKIQARQAPVGAADHLGVALENLSGSVDHALGQDQGHAQRANGIVHVVGRLLGAGLSVVAKARLAFQPVGVDHQAARGARRLAVGELGQAGGAAIWTRHDLIGFGLALSLIHI